MSLEPGYVRGIKFDRIERLRIKPNSYRVRHDRRAVWLQRACCWILEKLRANDDEITVEIQQVELDGGKFIERIFKQSNSLREMFDREPKELLIGSEDYRELMGETMDQPFEFQANYAKHYQRRDMMYPETIMFGLRVRVIPWMRGILVMPDPLHGRN